jgi:hypothetical protein
VKRKSVATPLSHLVPPNGKYRALLLVAPVVNEALPRWSPCKELMHKQTAKLRTVERRLLMSGV